MIVFPGFPSLRRGVTRVDSIPEEEKKMTRIERESRACYRRASECYRSAIIAAEHGEEELALFWGDKAISYEDQAGLILRFAALLGDSIPGPDFDPTRN